MKRKAMVFAALFVLVATLLGASTSVTAQGGGTAGQAQPNISQDEQNLARKITAAPDGAAKLKAAAELIKKHPKTAIRAQVAREVATRIQEVKDPAQKLTLAQEFQTIFNDPTEEEIVVPIFVDAYADAQQPDQAFAKGSDFLSRHPDSLRVLVQLLSIGTDEAKKQNAKFIDQTIRYGSQVITMAEADRKPANIDDPSWQQFKARTLPSIHQSMGLLYMSKGARADARAQYTKASQLSPNDPFNFVMLGALLNEDYHNEAKAYQSMPPGQARDAQLKKVQDLMDTVIDTYARAIALSEGNAALQQVRQQYIQDLASYYKYRHNNSTEGMQQLIDKYKVAPKP